MKGIFLKVLITGVIIIQSIIIYSLKIGDSEFHNPKNNTENVYLEQLAAKDNAIEVLESEVSELGNLLKANSISRQNSESLNSAIPSINNISNNQIDTAELSQEEIEDIQKKLNIERMLDPENRTISNRMGVESFYGEFIYNLGLSIDDEEVLFEKIYEIFDEHYDLAIKLMSGEINRVEMADFPRAEKIRNNLESVLSKHELTKLDEYESKAKEREQERSRESLKAQISMFSPRINEQNKDYISTVINEEFINLQESMSENADPDVYLLRIAFINASAKINQDNNMELDQLELTLKYLQDQLGLMPEKAPY